MMRFLVKSRKCLFSNVALWASFVNFLSSDICYTQEFDDQVLAAAPSSFSEEDQTINSNAGVGYTVNFNNVPIIEVIRFVSKITNTNFIFQEQDLQFNVTIVSEDPITVKNIMSALIQVLRVYDLVLLEQDNNLLITKSTSVNQIPTIVSTDLPDSLNTDAPIITRVFRIKNANASSIANIIRPLTSKAAMIEVSNETRQLIVTDITTNVDKIASLLSSLDAPHTPLEIESYSVKNISPTDIISLTTQILSPFSEGNPLIFVPQFETNTIFIVSTPYLIERALTVMEDVDIEPKAMVIGQKPASPEGVFVYKILNKSPEDLISSLQEVAEQIQETNAASSAHLIQALKNVKYISDTNSLMFVTDSATWTKVQEILSGVDTSTGPIGSNTFYIYKIQKSTGPQMEAALHEMEENIQDKDLINTINSMKWIKESNSLVFNGSQNSIKRLENILPTLDIVALNPIDVSKSHFLIYNPKHQPGSQLASDFEEMTDNLKSSGLSNPALISALESMKWIPATNSLIFTGDPASLEHIQSIINSLDVANPSNMPSQVFIYKPLYASEEQLKEALEHFAQNLDPNSASDENLAQAIHSAQWVPESESFVFKGDADTITRLKEILSSLDNPQGLIGGISKGFYLYKLKYAPGDVIIEDLKNLGDTLSSSDISNKNIVKSINNLKWIKENNALLITGSSGTIEQVKSLIAEFDTPSAGTNPVVTPKSEFYIYKPVHQTPEQIETSLGDLAHDLEDSGLIDPDLLHTLTSMRLVPSTNSILFTGTPASLEKVKAILVTVDVVNQAATPIQTIGTTTFFIYKIKTVPASQLISSLKNFAQDLEKTNVQDKELADAINTVKYIKETNSLLFTGSQETLTKVEKLAEKFDVSGQVETPREPAATSSYVVYNPKYQSGDELITILCDFMDNLMSSGVSDPGLFDAISHLKYIEKTNSLIITGDQDSIGKVEQLLIKFDIASKTTAQPSISSIESANFLIYKLQYHKGSELQSALKQIASSLAKTNGTNTKNLIDAINSLQWIEVTNSLLGTGDPDVLAKLKELIENLDVPLRQVFIEMLVIETSLFNSQTFGLQWGTQLQYLNKTIGAMGNAPISSTSQQSSAVANTVNFIPSVNATTAAAPPVQGTGSTNSVPFSTGFDLGVIGDIIMHKGKSFISLGALVDALQVDNVSTVILNPKIITQDGHTSTLFVGQNIPFTGSFVQNTGSNATVQTSNIEYRDVGINLTITPTLGTNNIITLDISQDISEVVQSSQSSSNTTVNGIQTSHTTMTTNVHVPDRHFLCLSGNISDTKNHFRTGIPCLGGLPVIGALFAENDRADAKANIIIFLRPFIINSFEDYDRLTEGQENLYKGQAKIRVLREEFDDATEMIKSLDNE